MVDIELHCISRFGVHVILNVRVFTGAEGFAQGRGESGQRLARGKPMTNIWLRWNLFPKKELNFLPEVRRWGGMLTGLEGMVFEVVVGKKDEWVVVERDEGTFGPIIALNAWNSEG